MILQGYHSPGHRAASGRELLSASCHFAHLHGLPTDIPEDAAVSLGSSNFWFWRGLIGSSIWFWFWHLVLIIIMVLDLIIQSIFWSPTWSWLIADRLFLQYRCRDHHVPMSSLGKLGCRVMKRRKLATRTNSWWMQRISRKLEVQVAFRSWVRRRKSLAVPWCPWSCVFPWHNSDVYRSNKYRTNTEK